MAQNKLTNLSSGLSHQFPENTPTEFAQRVQGLGSWTRSSGV